jgi:hypothetical protein
MARANLPNLNHITDHLRADNNAVGNQSEAFLIGGAAETKPANTSDSDNNADSKVPNNHTNERPAPADVFPWMRAYGCLGSKTTEEK